MRERVLILVEQKRGEIGRRDRRMGGGRGGKRGRAGSGARCARREVVM